MTLDQQRSGERVYDINADGVAHYGLYPDWIEDLRMQAGNRIVRDMGRGAEAYLQMWERADGIEEVRCDRWRQRFLTARGFARRLRARRPAEAGAEARRPAGEPDAHLALVRERPQPPEADGEEGRRKQVVAVFDRRGRVALIATTLRKHRADGIRAGMPAGARREPRAFGHGSGPRRGRRARFFYGVGGRVSFVGVASRDAAASPAR